ncbi:MAG: hypothetical protein IT426_18085 [Pirellulales bacterium]|nr:hypothetical protein [Pirellulales bacterium]
MFSAYRFSAKYAFPPKNGPVPDRGANAYARSQRRRRTWGVAIFSPAVAVGSGLNEG